MNPQDDPEERIRQLEQQSANYGAVELGATDSSGGTTPTSALPPPVYGAPSVYGTEQYANPYQGDPYQPPFGTQYTPVQKKGAPVGLIFGLIAVVVVAVFGGIAAIVWNVVSATDTFTIRPDADRNNQGGGSFDEPGAAPTIEAPSILPTMPSVPALPGDESQAGSPGELLSVAGIDKNETIACNDANVNVSGVNNMIELTGHCLSVRVSGVNNRVTVEGTDMIGASGFDNQVIYLSGDPQIESTASNTVRRG